MFIGFSESCCPRSSLLRGYSSVLMPRLRPLYNGGAVSTLTAYPYRIRLLQGGELVETIVFAVSSC